ncbi:Crystal protein ET79 [Kitasatospora sp. NPDC058201]|uniref:Crystal protein ET79 n=1 Tax=unclassified Kitasatospora TaxID=2633591 RepID=UPI00365B17AA
MTTKRSLRSSVPKAVLSAALLLGGTLATVPAAHAAEAAPTAAPSAAPSDAPAAVQAARSTRVTLVNQSGSQMVQSWENLSHGCWTNGELPLQYLFVGQSITWASESCGALTGTEGDVGYVVAGGSVSIHWNNPYLGSNSYSCTVPGGYSCERTGGGGNNAEVTFRIKGGNTLAGTADANDDGPDALQAARSTHVTLGNNTGHQLTRTYDSLSRGIWSTNQLPPGDIPAWHSGSWQSESDGFLTGTEGEVQYNLAGVGAVTVHWNNPYAGSNSYSCTVPVYYSCVRSGGSGNNAAVGFTVSRA